MTTYDLGNPVATLQMDCRDDAEAKARAEQIIGLVKSSHASPATMVPMKFILSRKEVLGEWELAPTP